MVSDEKKGTAWLVTALFIIVIIGGVSSLYATKEWVRHVIRQEVARQEAVNRYQTNHTACGIRALIDLPAQQKTLATYRAAVKDKELSPKAHARNVARLAAAEHELKQSEKVIVIFGTIPPDYECKALPSTPPHAP